MLEDIELENKINQNETKIKTLSIQLESLNREINDFFKNLDINIESLNTFISNKENFSEKNWEELNKQKKLLEENLQQKLDNIRNPLKVKASYAASMHVRPHWLFVK